MIVASYKSAPPRYSTHPSPRTYSLYIIHSFVLAEQHVIMIISSCVKGFHAAQELCCSIERRNRRTCEPVLYYLAGGKRFASSLCYIYFSYVSALAKLPHSHFIYAPRPACLPCSLVEDVSASLNLLHYYFGVAVRH